MLMTRKQVETVENQAFRMLDALKQVLADHNFDAGKLSKATVREVEEVIKVATGENSNASK